MPFKDKLVHKLKKVSDLKSEAKNNSWKYSYQYEERNQSTQRSDD